MTFFMFFMVEGSMIHDGDPVSGVLGILLQWECPGVTA